MPLAFGAILGGTCTLIGTSTNLAVSGALPRYGMQPFTMFELTRVGVIIVAVGMVYMLLVGLRLLPRGKSAESLTEQYHVRQYMTEVIVLDNSPLIGKSLAEARISEELDLTVLGILRGEERYRIAPSPGEEIKADDLLLVQGRVEDILRVKAEAGIEIKPDFTLNDSVLEGKDTELFEAMVPRGSDFIGSTLKSLDFRKRHGVVVLAINRHGVNLLSKISRLQLRFGDVLLIQGNREPLKGLRLMVRYCCWKRSLKRQSATGEKAVGVTGFRCLSFLLAHSSCSIADRGPDWCNDPACEPISAHVGSL